MTDTADHVEVYTDTAGDHRWRYVDGHNGNTLADSGQGYSRQIDCLKGLAHVLDYTGSVTVEASEADGQHAAWHLTNRGTRVFLIDAKKPVIEP